MDREGIVPAWVLSPEKLAPGVAPGTRDALMAEGAQLAEEEVIRLVLSGGAASRSETRENEKKPD